MNKIPVGMLVGLYMIYLGYDFYSFNTSAESPLQQKQAQIDSVKTEINNLNAKVKEAEEFIKNLEIKKLKLRTMASQLSEMKATVSEHLDIPMFIKMIVTEAKKVGITVVKINPTVEKKQEFYVEQPFELGFRGVYVQLLVFLERLSNVQKIVRVDDFSIRPTARSDSRYVELEGSLILKVYKYYSSKADDIAVGSGP
jgi:Tfp pilus assembly protein PilO